MSLITYVRMNHATKLNFISSLIIILVSANQFSCRYCLDYRLRGKIVKENYLDRKRNFVKKSLQI